MFSHWTGGVAVPTSARTSVTMNGPVTVTANFAAIAPPSATLAPSALTFSAVSGAASSSQTATLTNTGTALLSITGITVTGANPSDFSFTTNCGTTLNAAASCSIILTFTPSSVATFSANLSVADNASGAPQTVGLTGTGTHQPSFTLSADRAKPTASYGGTAESSITATALNGTFPGQIALTVSVLPEGATASFAPPSLAPGSSSANSELTIQIPNTLAKGQGQPSLWHLQIPSLAFLCLFYVPRKLRRKALTALVLTVVTAAAIGGITGCSGGFNVSNPRTINVTVTGTSGSLHQTTTVLVTVQ